MRKMNEILIKSPIRRAEEMKKVSSLSSDESQLPSDDFIQSPHEIFMNGEALRSDEIMAPTERSNQFLCNPSDQRCHNRIRREKVFQLINSDAEAS